LNPCGKSLMRSWYSSSGGGLLPMRICQHRIPK
jgi:hypothetical protein